jgi:hypothetical protein
VALVAGIAAALSVAACTASPAATPSPTPEPTPTVVSVAGPFTAAISDRNFQFAAEIAGTVTPIGAAKKVAYPATGAFSYRAGDYSLRLETTDGSHSTTLQFMGIGKYLYVDDESGHWTREARPTGSQARGLAAVFFVDRAIVDQGLDRLSGRTLHKLSWFDGPGLDPNAIDFEGLPTGGMIVRVYFWADDQGTPVAVTYDITTLNDDGVSQLEWSLDFEITKLSGIKITAPAV